MKHDTSQACVSNCNSCPDSKSCSTCARDYNLLADKSGCVLNCPAGFKASSSFECVASGASTTPAVCLNLHVPCFFSALHCSSLALH